MPAFLRVQSSHSFIIYNRKKLVKQTPVARMHHRRLFTIVFRFHKMLY